MADVDARSKLLSKLSCGITLQAASTIAANALSACAWDFLIIDPVNSPLTQLQSAAMQTAVGDTSKTLILMKIGGPKDRSGAQQATDTGAAGIVIPGIRTAADLRMGMSPCYYPPAGDRSFFGPTRSHYLQGMVYHILQSDSSIVVCAQLEKAKPEAWEDIMAVDSFHVALLDIPQLCVELGLYDELLAAPPEGDGTLPSRLQPWVSVYASPPAALVDACTKFVALATAAGKVAGCLLGEQSHAEKYAAMGFQFISVGSDLTLMMSMVDAAIKKQTDNPTHSWSGSVCDTTPDAKRSQSFLSLLKSSTCPPAHVLGDVDYDSVRAVRPASVVLVDTLRPALGSPGLLSNALRSLDGEGHRLVRVISASDKDTPMSATIALNLGADSIVVPVSTLLETKEVMAAKSYKGSRALNFHPEATGRLPFHVAKKPTAGVELLSLVDEIADILEEADFVMASVDCWRTCYGDASFASELKALELECERAAKRLFLLNDKHGSIKQSDFSNAILITTPDMPPDEDAVLEAQNAKLAAFKEGMKSKGEKTIGEVSICASPTSVASYIAMGLDWIWIEWQHAPLDMSTFQAQCRAINQRGGISVVRTAGYHDRTGIQQCLDAGVDVLLIPYVQTLEEAEEGMRHCLFAPKGDRVHNGTFLASKKKPLIMFQLETSKCIDNLEAMYKIPEVDFGFVGPGDLAMSMGISTRDGLPGMMQAPELKWAYKYIVDTVNKAGCVAGGFTRGGDPSALLKHGFAMVALSHDGIDLMAGSEIVMTGASLFPPAKGPPGLVTKLGYLRNNSNLIPAVPSVYACCKMIPTVMGHMFKIKSGTPTLLLPKAMPKDVSNALDMETPEEQKP